MTNFEKKHMEQYLHSAALMYLATVGDIELPSMEAFEELESTVLELVTNYIDECKPKVEAIERARKAGT